MTPEQHIQELQKALTTVLKCAFRMQDHNAGWRFSFRVDNLTADHWKELVTTTTGLQP